ncbi:hypothetical protein KM043_005032 [Ampulex compressa]|nr:hypothetical protein KM043_005032 [Ampulex compressa]
MPDRIGELPTFRTPYRGSIDSNKSDEASILIIGPHERAETFASVHRSPSADYSKGLLTFVQCDIPKLPTQIGLHRNSPIVRGDISRISYDRTTSSEFLYALSEISHPSRSLKKNSHRCFVIFELTNSVVRQLPKVRSALRGAKKIRGAQFGASLGGAGDFPSSGPRRLCASPVLRDVDDRGKTHACSAGMPNLPNPRNLVLKNERASNEWARAPSRAGQAWSPGCLAAWQEIVALN